MTGVKVSDPDSPWDWLAKAIIDEYFMGAADQLHWSQLAFSKWMIQRYERKLVTLT